jgi:hypothetical protein
MGLSELSAQLTTLQTQYTTLADQATASPSQIQTLLPQIQSVNQQIASVLDQMIKEMQYAGDDANSEAYRDQLVEILTRIQSDYNGLKTNTDALQTLKRIRSFQDTSWQPTLNLYVALLLLIAAVVFLVLVLRRQSSASTIAPTTSPIATPPLM